MTRLMILMGALVAMLGACGPPDAAMTEEVQSEQDGNVITGGR